MDELGVPFHDADRGACLEGGSPSPADALPRHDDDDARHRRGMTIAGGSNARQRVCRASRLQHSTRLQ